MVIKPATDSKIAGLAEVETFYTIVRLDGHEGLVVKPLRYEVVPRRSWNFMKMKDSHTEDLKVIGTFEGTKRLTGMLGGIVLDFNGQGVGCGSGFSGVQREVLWDTELRGLIAEVGYHEITDGGSLRHPVFIRWREVDSNGGKI